jgi:hypothetical protein
MTKATQTLLIDANNAQLSIVHMIDLAHALECSMAIHGVARAGDLNTALVSQIVNTPNRAQAYFAANALVGGLGYTLTPKAQLSMQCTFDPALLPN